MTALRCSYCHNVVRRVPGLYPAAFSDLAGEDFCPDGVQRHVAEHTTEVTPSPLLTVPGDTDQFGRRYQTYADPWGVV